MRRAPLLATGLLIVTACAGRESPPARVDATGQGRDQAQGSLRPPSDFAVDFLLRQQLTLRLGGREESLQTALQRRGDHLVLLGLTPLGTRAFVVEQRGQEVTSQTLQPEGELPFPPRLILLDIQRTLLPVLSTTPLADGEHRGQVEEEQVREQWAGSRLLERRFRRPGGEQVIRYAPPGLRFGEAPGSIEIDNGWLGYHLTLTTLGYQELAPLPDENTRDSRDLE